MPGFSVYCATKAALELLTETLADEVPGDRFVVVEPGAFRTGLFGGGAPVLSRELPAYRDTVGPTRRATPHAFVSDVRAEAVRRRLAAGATVAAVAGEVGVDPRQLRRLHRRCVGEPLRGHPG
ncbi:Transposase [Geodermatophilus amargosae]|uniref:Transposase n=1 Tax=Geodermatophilus amargosae TaxID=1296565 RepID=A0A1I6YKW7_9ACTN|nr:Transposase [Geodermatophilus amargosae]